jgi:uncharacterized protein (TIGR02594 family)
MPLSPQKLAEATSYNVRKARKVGWAERYAQLASLFGLDKVTPTPEQFAQAVADWQAAHPPLTPDGKLGPNTWGQLKPLTNFSAPPTPLPAWLQPGQDSGSSQGPAPGVGSGPRWLQVAEDQLARWNKEIASWEDQSRKKDAEQYLDWDEAYFAASPYWGGKQHAAGEIPASRDLHWCAAFANYCLHRAGFSHTGSAGAGSFLRTHNWHFTALKEPRKGCVIVVGGTSAAHVGFLYDWHGLPIDPKGDVIHTSKIAVKLLGGNQSDRITVKNETRNLLAAKGRNGITSPYLWPDVGPPSCQIPLSSEQPHFCRFGKW